MRIEKKRSPKKQAANRMTYTRPLKKGNARAAFGGKKK
jgi:hypothetical protein